MNEYLSVIKSNQLKITPRRRAVVEFFLKRKTQLGPYDVHAHLKKTMARIGLPTVYRILDELSELGILVRVLSEDRQLYYSLCECPHEHHHHFVCRKCKKIEEVARCGFDEIARHIEKDLDCKVESHVFQIEGLCAGCK